ncbi:MAG: tRNA pseudouridine(55) synthase TruB [Clostridiales bacterium]|nr:tRNA pseudouridine(55) synthase TruB [Clostridiales bacterium]
MAVKYKNPDLSGIMNVYKEKGMTSHDVVAAIRRLTGAKTGHAGTLDPDAEGVLVVLLGKCTKLSGKLMDGGKVYRAVCKLGETTDTQDASGVTLRRRPAVCGLDEIVRACSGFAGGYEQVPPMYSALKVGGRKLYDIARAGGEVERAARFVRIDGIRVEAFDPPDRFTMRVECGKGTYIRTLCADIGEELGCGAHMESLVRLSVGKYSAGDAVTLGRLRELAAQGRLSGAIMDGGGPIG